MWLGAAVNRDSLAPLMTPSAMFCPSQFRNAPCAMTNAGPSKCAICERGSSAGSRGRWLCGSAHPPSDVYLGQRHLCLLFFFCGAIQFLLKWRWPRYSQLQLYLSAVPIVISRDRVSQDIRHPWRLGSGDPVLLL